jgi:mycoredoxin
MQREMNQKAMSQKIRMYTTYSCSDCRRAKWFLSERQLPFEEINIEETPEAEEFVLRANAGRRKLPTFDVGGRTFHCSPYDPEKLRRELGL